LKSNIAVFLDLNGTLVLPCKPQSLGEMKLIPGADRAVVNLLQHGIICSVITIQSGIEKKRFTEEEFRRWFSAFFADLGLDLKGPYICPHRFAKNCICKKPNSFLYEQAAKDYAIDLSNSYVIGDTVLDVMAGKNMGGYGCLVRTGYAESENEYLKARPFASYVGQTLGDVVNWILSNERNQTYMLNTTKN
jgi:D-glycero-D-manno-heptose 1,7-bisphosphate phosphatase